MGSEVLSEPLLGEESLPQTGAAPGPGSEPAAGPHTSELQPVIFSAWVK